MLTSTVFDLSMIREDARLLVNSGKLGRQQPIYALSHHIPMREWEAVETTLEQNGYLLRDRIIDLLGQEEWDND